MICDQVMYTDLLKQMCHQGHRKKKKMGKKRKKENKPEKNVWGFHY